MNVRRAKLNSLLKRFTANSRGVAAVEFGLIIPVFLAVLGVIFEVSYMLFVDYAIQGGVQDAGRAIRTGFAQENQWKRADLIDKVCKFAIVVPDCKTSLKVYVSSADTFSAIGTGFPDFNTMGTNAATSQFNCGGNQKFVVMIAYFDHTMKMPFMSAFANFDSKTKRRIVGYSFFRNEPFPTTKNCSLAA